MSCRSVSLAAIVMSSVFAGRSEASSNVLDWAYRCEAENTIVYFAVRTTNFQLLERDLDTANMLVTPQGASTERVSLDDADGFRTDVLRVNDFNQLLDVVRAGLESNDGAITRWIEVTIPALDGGTLYSFSATGPNLSTASVNSWQTTIDCGDDTPPVLACTVAEQLLWPPNHQLVNVGLELLELTDDQDPAPTADIVVYSNEDVNDKGDGNTDEDAVDVDFETLQLRAERSGKGDGRVYLIVVTARDASGNESVACHTVVVPKSMGRKHRAAVEDAAMWAEVFCDDVDALTDMGFSLIGASLAL